MFLQILGFVTFYSERKEKCSILRSLDSLLQLLKLVVDFVWQTFPDLGREVVLQFADLLLPKLLWGREQGFQVHLILESFGVKAAGSRNEPDGRTDGRLLVAVASAKGPVDDANVVAETYKVVAPEMMVTFGS